MWLPQQSTAVAKHLADIGVKLVGIDYYSIDPPEGTLAAHRIFLRMEISIIEGINLSGVTPGDYELICLPLKITGADGSTCRVILREL